MTVKWKGVFPAATTQFKADYSLDVPATLRHLDAMLDAGVEGLIMLGTVGENCSLEYPEKLELLRATVEHVAGRVPVLTGVAEYTTAARLPVRGRRPGGRGRRADGAAGDGLQLRPPRDDRPLPRRGRRRRPAGDGLQQPRLLQSRHHAGDVRRAGRRAQTGGDQGVVGKRPAVHRPAQRRRRPLHPVLRRGRPGPGGRPAGGRGVGVGAGERLPPREPRRVAGWP